MGEPPRKTYARPAWPEICHVGANHKVVVAIAVEVTDAVHW
jgi:hypothetical protein